MSAEQSRTPVLDDRLLRRRSAESVRRGDGGAGTLRPLRRLAFVGALRCELGAGDIDSLRMARTLDYLLRSGIAIDPEFEIDVVNLAHGRDFLAEETAADAVFVAFVPNVELRMFPRVEEEVVARQRRGAPLAASFFWQARSMRHSAAAWRSRVAATGCELLLCFAGRYEINTTVFEDTPLVPVIPTPPFPWQPPHRGWNVEQLYGVDWDVPFRWFSLMAAPSYLRRWAAAGPPPTTTMLAAELTRLAEAGAD